MASSDFPKDISPDEAQCGFTEVEAKSGVRLVVRELRGGLRAVKVRRDDGVIEYEVCDEELRPVYSPAQSLPELRRRFGQR